MRTVRNAHLVAATIALAIICNVSTAQLTLTTTFAAGNGQSGNMFDVEANIPVIISGIDLHFSLGAGTVVNVSLYEVTGGGSHAGISTNAALWTLTANANVTCAGPGNPTPFTAPLAIAVIPGLPQGLFVTVTSGTGMNYTNGPAGSYQNVFVNDGNILVRSGIGKGLPLFTGGNFGGLNPGVSDSRVWNGRIHYVPSNPPNNGTGQPPQPGAAEFNINNAVDVDGFPVLAGANGPFSVNLATGQNANFKFSGGANQPIILLAGNSNPAVANFPGIGKVDIGLPNVNPPFIPVAISVVSNGATGAGFFGTLFVLDSTGKMDFSISSSGLPPGLQLGFQAVMFTGGPNVVALSNSVVINTVP